MNVHAVSYIHIYIHIHIHIRMYDFAYVSTIGVCMCGYTGVWVCAL